MKAKFGRLLVLVLVALLAYLLVLSVQRLLGIGAPTLAERLPEDTLAWVSVQDMDSMIASFGGEPTLQQVLGLLGEDAAFLEFLQEHMDEDLTEKTAERLLKWLADVKSMDVLFQGVSISRGGPLPELALILEFPSGSAVAATTEKLGRLFPDQSDYAGSAVYELDKALADEMDGGVPCMGAQGKHLLFSLDRKTLTNSLDILREGSRKPLAKNKDFRRLAKGTAKLGSHAWASPGLVDEMLDLASKEEQQEIRSVLKVSGLDKVVGLWAARDQATGQGVLRLGVEPKSKLATTFSLASTKRNFASVVPDDAWFVASVSIEDGEALWQRFNDFAYDLLRATGEVDSRSEYDEELGEFEAELGVRPQDALAVLSDIGVYLSGKGGIPIFGVLLRVNDKGAAEDLLQKIAKELGGGGASQPLEVKGKEIHSLAGFLGYVQIDDVFCFGMGQDNLKTLVEAEDAGKVLVKTAGYASVAARLPKTSAARGFCDLTGVAERMGPAAGPLGEMLKTDGEMRDKTVAGLTLRAERGVFELASASPGAATVGKLLSRGLIQALKDARGKAMQIRDMSNLRQLGIALAIYCADNDGRFPKDLGELVPYLRDMAVFRCPASRRAPPPDARAIAQGDCDYLYFTPVGKASALRAPSREPIMATHPGLLVNDGMNVAYVDGHVECHTTRNLPARVRAALEKEFGRNWLQKLQTN